MIAAAEKPDHPSPHRDRVNPWILLAALAAGPAAWIAQLVLSYGVAAWLCYPRNTPRLDAPPSAFFGERIGLIILNLACLAVAAAGTLLAAWAWRRSRGETGGDIHNALETGEG
ncbi:MAG: hypothetical protein ACREQ5_37695, partial [Candidatus Dormibacteria bacterium]